MAPVVVGSITCISKYIRLYYIVRSSLFINYVKEIIDKLEVSQFSQHIIHSHQSLFCTVNMIIFEWRTTYVMRIFKQNIIIHNTEQLWIVTYFTLTIWPRQSVMKNCRWLSIKAFNQFTFKYQTQITYRQRWDWPYP